MKKIILTGGGTAGHVTPNLALIPNLKAMGFDIHYIGSHQGIEKELITPLNIPYHGIASGKLRRYFSLQNFTDPFRVIKGFFEARKLIKEHRPDIIFSKGGFVSVPVVKAAKSFRVPVIIHESDITPGLANKLSFSAAQKICCNFPETLEYLPKEKAILTGSPIRQELFQGSREQGRSFCNFSRELPVILVMGGSLGSIALNQTIRQSLDLLLQNYNVVHLCGKNKVDISYDNLEGYAQYEYLSHELPDIIALSDLVVSRAGANAICEFVALEKPNLLIPLSAKSSRGDQILNAHSFAQQGFSAVLQEEELSVENLVAEIHKVSLSQDTYIENMKRSRQHDAIATIMELIQSII